VLSMQNAANSLSVLVPLLKEPNNNIIVIHGDEQRL
jgi:hypothetical protein